MDGPNIGPVVGVAFGCAWGVAGATALPRPWETWAIGSSIGISAALIVALAVPQKQRDSGTFRGHIYGIAVAFEVAAIFGTIWLLRQFALSQFLLPGIGFIVGLHFSWAVEGDRSSSLSLDRAGDVPRVRRRRIAAWSN